MMKGQMHMYDFMEPEKSMFELLFEKVDDPVFVCVNCLCKYCANNVEELHGTVKPKEQRKPCFNCDECFEFDGDPKYRICDKESCDSFVMSDYGAKRKRKGIKVVKNES